MFTAKGCCIDSILLGIIWFWASIVIWNVFLVATTSYPVAVLLHDGYGALIPVVILERLYPAYVTAQLTMDLGAFSA